MKHLTVVLPHAAQPSFEATLRQFIDSPLVQSIIVIHNGSYTGTFDKCRGMHSSTLTAGTTLNRIIESTTTDGLLFVTQSQEVQLGQAALARFLTVAESTGAGLVYSDYYEVKNGVRSEHPVIDYQFGSVRDGFEFGALMFFTVKKVREALKRYGAVPSVEYAGLYDLRLKVSVEFPVFHIQEYLFTKVEADLRKTGEKLFDYVDPKNRAVQIEMEEVATQHLKNVGVYLAPSFKPLPEETGKFPVEASVIVPVRNREKTVGEAVRSVLGQKLDAPFNVIVVDNHSTDGTTKILADLAAGHPHVKHLIPSRHDLAIGGCWNEAVLSDACGRYAVQLDSDDLYSGPDTLQKVVDVFRSGPYAMVIGSYTLVDMNLREIPPGLIDHKEWTPENGRNNALRINGLGAPRAFRTSLLRQILLPNVSYGEDYAVALRLSREYQIGRIYESIYHCRRWEGNTDAALSIEKANRNDYYKDKVRTIEMFGRQRENGTGGRSSKT